jgi:hypothetical protein
LFVRFNNRSAGRQIVKETGSVNDSTSGTKNYLGNTNEFTGKDQIQTLLFYYQQRQQEAKSFSIEKEPKNYDAHVRESGR